MTTKAQTPGELSSPSWERIRLFRERILDGMTREQAEAADAADEKGRWGSGQYGCGYGDGSEVETLEEVFSRELGDDWWEQVCAEADQAAGLNWWNLGIPEGRMLIIRAAVARGDEATIEGLVAAYLQGHHHCGEHPLDCGKRFERLLKRMVADHPS